MGGSNNLKYYEESSIVSFNTNYATGDLYANGLEVNVDSGGGRYFVGLESGVLGNVYTLTNKMKGKNPIFGKPTFDYPAGSPSAPFHAGGTAPLVNPSSIQFIEDYYLFSATGEARGSVFGSGGSGIGTDSTFIWPYAINARVHFAVQTLLDYEPSLCGTWSIEIVRVTGVTLSVPLKYSLNYNKLGYDYFSPSTFCCIDQPPQGEHTYKIRLSSNVTSGLVALTGVKLVIHEI